MSYRCLDCTYQGTQFVAGACPGCGSHNIRRVGNNRPENIQPKARIGFKAALGIALWVYLFIRELVMR